MSHWICELSCKLFFFFLKQVELNRRRREIIPLVSLANMQISLCSEFLTAHTFSHFLKEILFLLYKVQSTSLQLAPWCEEPNEFTVVNFLPEASKRQILSAACCQDSWWQLIVQFGILIRQRNQWSSVVTLETVADKTHLKVHLVAFLELSAIPRGLHQVIEFVPKPCQQIPPTA